MLMERVWTTIFLTVAIIMRMRNRVLHSNNQCCNSPLNEPIDAFYMRALFSTTQVLFRYYSAECNIQIH